MGYIVKAGKVEKAHKVRLTPIQRTKISKPTKKQISIMQRIAERKKMMLSEQ